MFSIRMLRVLLLGVMLGGCVVSFIGLTSVMDAAKDITLPTILDDSLDEKWADFLRLLIDNRKQNLFYRGLFRYPFGDPVEPLHLSVQNNTAAEIVSSLPPQIELKGILYIKGKSIVIMNINGQNGLLMRKGDSVDDVKILDIKVNEVVVKYKGTVFHISS